MTVGALRLALYHPAILSAMSNSHPSGRLMRLLATAGVLMATTVGTVLAQDLTTNPGELVTRYLQQDVFLRPGVGFQRVKLGQSFASVARTWGRPSAAGRTGLLGTRKVWSYRAGPNTNIVLSGGDRVTSIEVRGNMVSPYQSSEGIGFGTTPQQVTTVYGEADRATDIARLSYLSRGIEFSFSSGALRAMRVFPPDR